MCVLDEEKTETQETPAEEPSKEAEAKEQPGGEITIDDSGEIDIPDSFWDDAAQPEPAPKEPTPEKPEKPEEQKPSYYTPEDFAKAYQSGQIDESKIDPAVIGFYKAAAAVERQKSDAAELQRQAMETSQPAAQPPALTWNQLMEAGKVLASKYLGIKPEEFDDYSADHQTARLMAVNEIRERAADQARQGETDRRAYQARVAGISNLYSEYKQKEPEFDDIGEKFFPLWRQNLTMKQHEAVNRILSQGNEAQIRQLFDVVIADYKAGKEPKKKETASPPPPVISAAGTEGEGARGMVDISKLGDMSPDEQAEWLIKNQFVM
jgi:hypothetical protein